MVTLTATLTPEEGGYVARCVEVPVTTEGETIEEALAALREAVELWLEDQVVPLGKNPLRLGTQTAILAQAGISL